jgi:hypothetical protein
MKRAISLLLLAALACFWCGSACAASSNDVTPGYLTINRLPTVGGGVGAFISIDGVFVARIGWGESYHGAILPGDHLLSVTRHPYYMIRTPAERRIHVESGHSYVLTLKWKADRLVLK